MNIFDSTMVFYVNSLSQHSLTFDNLMGYIAGNNMFKGGVLSIIIWRLWFTGKQSRPHGREYIISTIISCFVAIALARMLAVTLPFRLRPFHATGLNFVLPYGVNPNVLDGWSSFPSDHAVLFFTLSTGLLFLSSKIGVFALAYTALFIGFPRVYLGLHYPTDVIGGAVLGMSIGWFGNRYIVRNNVFRFAFRWLDARPGVLYPLFFILTYQIADLFDTSRGLLSGALELIQIMLT
ncbi:MAG: phosphatase PAP2 family protein [Deltaproteobacteria bacterium]|nr:phosphatase PAP2 family protein [Deltaproteobacteria bacterium]